MRPISIRLGSLDSKSNDIREFGRASDLSNIDLEKTNAPSKRAGYVRRLGQQLSGPVRLLHSFGGLCGRFYQYNKGAGLFVISGTQGSGALRETLDLDTQYPVDPADIGNKDYVGSGAGNAGNTETPGGAGSVVTDDGVTVQGPGFWRQPEDVSGVQDLVDSDPTSPDFSFAITAVMSALNTASLSWGYSAPDGASADGGYVEVYRLYGSGNPAVEGTLVTRSSSLVGTYEDTVDEYSDNINYSILFYLGGIGTYGPFSATEMTAKAKTLTVSAPATANTGTAFDLTIQAVHWTGANDTSFAGSCTIDLSGSNSIAPVTTDGSGWTSGAKTVSCTISGSTTETATITVTDIVNGWTGSDSLSISNTVTFTDDFNRSNRSLNGDNGWVQLLGSSLAISSNKLVSSVYTIQQAKNTTMGTTQGTTTTMSCIYNYSAPKTVPPDVYLVLFNSDDSQAIYAVVDQRYDGPIEGHSWYLVVAIYNGGLVTGSSGKIAGWPTLPGTLTLVVDLNGGFARSTATFDGREATVTSTTLTDISGLTPGLYFLSATAIGATIDDYTVESS